uniref:Galactosylgalactosylxylosylprotein 3-beta-glucuronosyltransferase n=1 Tax=Globodera pallida TaxID=36090 RepID=A0A183BV84_GLOPA
MLRPSRLADMTRLSQTLMHVKNVHWIVIEDGDAPVASIKRVLIRSGIKHTYLAKNGSAFHKMAKKVNPIYKGKAWAPRNTALEYVRQFYGTKYANSKNAVLYFVDDDNMRAAPLGSSVRGERCVGESTCMDGTKMTVQSACGPGRHTLCRDGSSAATHGRRGVHVQRKRAAHDAEQRKRWHNASSNTMAHRACCGLGSHLFVLSPRAADGIGWRRQRQCRRQKLTVMDQMNREELADICRGSAVEISGALYHHIPEESFIYHLGVQTPARIFVSRAFLRRLATCALIMGLPPMAPLPNNLTNVATNLAHARAVVNAWCGNVNVSANALRKLCVFMNVLTHAITDDYPPPEPQQQ